MDTQSLVTVAPWTFIFTICNLFILMAIVKKLLFKQVKEILNKHAMEVNSGYADAEEAKESAEAMRAEYEQRLAAAKQEAAEIVKTASDSAARRSEQMVNAARAEAAALKTKADAEIEAQRKKAAGELKNDISDMALAIAGKVVGKELDGKTHQNLIDGFIAEVGDEV